MTPEQEIILIVDDDEAILITFATLIKHAQCEPQCPLNLKNAQLITLGSVAEAIKIMSPSNPAERPAIALVIADAFGDLIDGTLTFGYKQLLPYLGDASLLLYTADENLALEEPNVLLKPADFQTIIDAVALLL